MKYKIYQVKKDADLNEFGKNGYDIIPSTNYLLVKAVELPWDSKLVQAKLENVYANPEWKAKFYNNHKKMFRDTLHLKYHKNGEVVLSKPFKQMLQTWLIEINFGEDGWVGFTTVDQNDRNVYYNKDTIYEHFKDEMDILLNNNLIEEIEVEQ